MYVLSSLLANAAPGFDSNALAVASSARTKLAAQLPLKILCIGDSMSDPGYSLVSISSVLMNTKRF